MTYNTREEWLEAATDKLRDVLSRAGADVPDQVKVSCGFPSRGATSRKNQRLGEHWSPVASADNATHEIFVSPVLSDPLEVGATLAHELIHAALPKAGHRKPFKTVADLIGLTGPTQATKAGPMFTKTWKAISSDLGEYPHPRLILTHKAQKQTTRMLKAECVEHHKENGPEGAYIVRLSKKVADEGMPICPVHQVALALVEN